MVICMCRVGWMGIRKRGGEREEKTEKWKGPDTARETENSK